MMFPRRLFARLCCVNVDHATRYCLISLGDAVSSGKFSDAPNTWLYLSMKSIFIFIQNTFPSLISVIALRKHIELSILKYSLPVNDAIECLQIGRII